MGKKDPALRKRPTYKLKLTQLELLHLRDLFSVLLPMTMQATLSQALARRQDRAIVEASLWQKVLKACAAADVPIDDDAPDFVIVPSGPAPLEVYEVSANMLEAEDDEQGGGLLLEGEDDK